MGFQKWLLKNGPGSPGDTAKSFTKVYNSHPKADHDADWKIVFLDAYNFRNQHLVFVEKGNLYNQVSPETIVNFSEGDLALFIYEMLFLESESFRKKIFPIDSIFYTTIEVIHETVLERSPVASIFKLSELQEKAVRFMQTV